MPVGEKEYMAVQFTKEYFTKANQICDETYEYLMGEREYLSTSMNVTGTIKEIKGEQEPYYYGWVNDTGFLGDLSQDEIKQYALPYIIVLEHAGWLSYTGISILIAFMSSFVIYLLYVFIRIMTGSYVSKVKRFIAKNPDISLDQIELDYERSVEIESTIIGKDFTFVFKGNSITILKNQDIIWSYLKRIKNKTNGIQTGITYQIIIFTRDKKEHNIGMKSEPGVIEALEELGKYNPHIVLGYSDDLKKMFKKDFDAFLDLSRRQVMQAATNAQVHRTEETSQDSSDSQGQGYGQDTVKKVILRDVGQNKIQIVAAIKDFLGCGLKEAKDLTDEVPSVIKENVSREDAFKIKEKLEGFGATVDIEY